MTKTDAAYAYAQACANHDAAVKQFKERGSAVDANATVDTAQACDDAWTECVNAEPDPV